MYLFIFRYFYTNITIFDSCQIVMFNSTRENDDRSAVAKYLGDLVVEMIYLIDFQLIAL